MKSRGSVATWTTCVAWALVLALAAAGAGCGGDDDGASAPDGGGGKNHVDDPQPAAGGGVGHGAVNGELNVFVLDARTKQPIAGASVSVGALAGATSASGLYTFSDASLVGAQDIAVAAAGHVPTSWFGANGAVVTITVEPTAAAPAPDTATVSGSITLPAPSTIGHATGALVLYSFTKDLDAPENHIAQPSTQTCFVLSAGSCNWSIKARTGPQSHYAVIVDVDPHGTPGDASDDTYTVMGYAARTGLDLTANQTVTGEQLTTLDTVDLHVSFPGSAPTGLGIVAALPVLELGDERMIFPVPLSPASTSARLPAPSGPFASGKWLVFAQAKKSKTADDPQSSTFVRDVDPVAALTLPAFPALPTALAVNGGTYSFTGVTGASVHSAEIDDASGKPLWQALVLDATHELTIAQTPDPLPAGPLSFKVSALRLSGFDPESFDIDANALTDSLDALSSEVLAFTH